MIKTETNCALIPESLLESKEARSARRPHGGRLTAVLRVRHFTSGRRAAERALPSCPQVFLCEQGARRGGARRPARALPDRILLVAPAPIGARANLLLRRRAAVGESLRRPRARRDGCTSTTATRHEVELQRGLRGPQGYAHAPRQEIGERPSAAGLHQHAPRPPACCARLCRRVHRAPASRGPGACDHEEHAVLCRV
ncbi:MAG: hypothetical protein CMP54_03965 [Flavobacteriales bacterium]|nr:hypothetical protein [Flavobacteriales bacterium]